MARTKSDSSIVRRGHGEQGDDSERNDRASHVLTSALQDAAEGRDVSA